MPLVLFQFKGPDVLFDVSVQAALIVPSSFGISEDGRELSTSYTAIAARSTPLSTADSTAGRVFEPVPTFWNIQYRYHQRY